MYFHLGYPNSLGREVHTRLHPGVHKGSNQGLGRLWSPRDNKDNRVPTWRWAWLSPRMLPASGEPGSLGGTAPRRPLGHEPARSCSHQAGSENRERRGRPKWLEGLRHAKGTARQSLHLLWGAADLGSVGISGVSQPRQGGNSHSALFKTRPLHSSGRPALLGPCSPYSSLCPLTCPAEVSSSQRAPPPR